ncbi:hypothetical protein [Nocardia sp. CA-290969]|uniref:hypothetical protein n=1 Tax=Nocardia sp. CA-290969 TaxID=3239986 RepID=UPI003D8DE490
MAREVRLLNTHPSADMALLQRIAAGIRALGPSVAPCSPSHDDEDVFRREVDLAVERLRSADIDVVRDAE